MKKTAITTTERTNEIATNTNKKGAITMKKTSKIRTRILAAILSAAAIFSVFTMTVTTATVSANAASIEETGKKIGIDAADAAFDTIADLFPGGKIVLSPHGRKAGSDRQQAGSAGSEAGRPQREHQQEHSVDGAEGTEHRRHERASRRL